MADQSPPRDQHVPEDAEAIIELTDVVASPETTSEDIIELTDVVEQNIGEDEDIIELTEVVDPSPVEAPLTASPDEEPIIELTEVVDAAGDDTPTMQVEEPDESPASLEQEGLTESVEESTSGDLAFAEIELDLEERNDEGLFDSLDMNLEADLLQPGEDAGELDFNLSTQELSDAIDLLDAKLAEEPPPKPSAVEDVDIQPPEALQTGQLETALENVVKKMFAEKIDHLLNDAIEKTVSAEIARLKEKLLGDNPEKH